MEGALNGHNADAECILQQEHVVRKQGDIMAAKDACPPCSLCHHATVTSVLLARLLTK